MKKPDGTPRHVEAEDESEVSDKYLVAEFRKENERLQKLVAKKQVAHESEINKLRAEHAEELTKAIAHSITLNFVGKDNKDSNSTE